MTNYKKPFKKKQNEPPQENIKFLEWKFKWGVVKNKYGNLLIYEPPKFFRGYSNLRYQANITQLIQSGEYECFIDVGAAWGYFERIASKHCKKVIAYEANPLRVGFLLYNCRDLYNVECKYAYVGANETVPRMGGPLEMVKAEHSDTYNINVLTLDKELEFLLPNLWLSDEMNKMIKPMKTLIKIDVEGGEIDVLRGATKLLEQPHIHWTIDVHPKQGVKIPEVIKFFKERETTNHANINIFFGDFKNGKRNNNK